MKPPFGAPTFGSFAASLLGLVVGNAFAYALLTRLTATHGRGGTPADHAGVKVVMCVAFATLTVWAAWTALQHAPVLAAEAARSRRLVALCAAGMMAGALAFAPLGSADNSWNHAMARGLALYGENPYTHRVDELTSDPVTDAASPTWRFASMAYGPVWTAASALPILATDNATLQAAGLRAMNGVAYWLAGWLLYRFLRRRAGASADASSAGSARVLLTFWLLNPVALFETANNGHNDGLLLPFLALAAIGMAAARLAAAAAGVIGAVLVKGWPAILLPLLIGVPATLKRKLLYACTAIGVMMAAWLPFWDGPATLEGMRVASNMDWTVSEYAPVRWFLLAVAQTLNLENAFEASKMLSLAMFGYVAVISAVMCWRKRISPQLAAIVVMGAYHAIWLSWVMPWYLLAFLPFAAIMMDARRAVVASAAVGVAAMLMYPLPVWAATYVAGAVMLIVWPRVSAAHSKAISPAPVPVPPPAP